MDLLTGRIARELVAISRLDGGGRMDGLTAVSLFAGIGGFDLALERAGVSVVAAVEIDPDCRGVLRRHFPRAAHVRAT